jgi:hypothetical protein
MDKKMDAFRLMSKKEYEFEEKKSELENAKDEYREVLISQTVDSILSTIKKEGNLTENDLKYFLDHLSLDTKHLYSK